MVSNPLFYQLLLIALVLLCLLVHIGLPNDPPRAPKTPLDPKPRRRRSKDPKPFAGLIHQPLCEACEQGADTRPKAPGSPPPVIIFTRGRRRTVEVKHRVVFGTKAAVDQVLSAFGWQINTAIVERLNLSLRQWVAAIRRRSASSCHSETGLTQPSSCCRLTITLFCHTRACVCL